MKNNPSRGDGEAKSIGPIATMFESGVEERSEHDRPALPGRYKDLGVIAQGAFGEVRRVHDTLLDCTLAMKLLHGARADLPHVRRRFLAEATITAQLQHPGVVSIHDRGELADGRLWFTMKEVRGRTLREVIDELHAASGPEGFVSTASGFSFRRLIEAFVRAAQTVAHAHSRSVVHRDIKPDNIMVGELGEVYVMDWGLARSGARLTDTEGEEGEHGMASANLASGMTHEGDILGTPAYMPPEQARGERERLGPESDVYALGAVLYHLLSGNPPYIGKGHEVLAKILLGERPPLVQTGLQGSSLPSELVEIAYRAMSPSIHDRTGSAAQMANDVVAWLDGVRRREQALERLDQARAIEPLIKASRGAAEAAKERARALSGDVRAFDPIEKKRPIWALEDEAAHERREAALAEARWLESVHGALSIDAGLPEAHAALADHYRDKMEDAERHHRDDDAARFEALLIAHDRGKYAAFLKGDGAVSLVTDPPGARVIADRYTMNDRRLSPVFFRDLGRTPLREVPLPYGSYLLRIQAPGRAEVRYPVLIERGEHWDGCAPGEREPLPIALPREGEIGEHECYVPAGYCITGGDPEAPDSLPLRRLWVDGFVVHRYPVTNAEYLVFLNDLITAGREAEATAACPRRQLGAAEGEEALSVLRRGGDGLFVLPWDWAPGQPVVLVDWHAASAYARWLASTAGHPMRLLNELEREKAARGADGRALPWGDHMDATFACALESHVEPPKRVAVEAYPADESPYGVRGLAGNTRDWCINVWKTGGPLIDGGRLRLDPAALDDPDFRAIRGGVWGSAMVNGRAAARYGGRPERCTLALGIRVARAWPSYGSYGG